MKKEFIIILACHVICYMFASFILWEFNPKQWHEAARFSLVLMSTILSITAVGFYSEIKEK